MKIKISSIGILIMFIIVNTLLSGCGNESVSLEGDWHFVSMLFDGTEVTPEGLKSIGHDEPTLVCTENEFTLTALAGPLHGTWKSYGDKQFGFYLDDQEIFTVTVKVDSNKQTLTLRDSYEVQKAMGSTLTIVFER